MSPQLEGFAPYDIGDLQLSDFFSDLDKIAVFEYCKDSNDNDAGDKADYYFFLKRHDLEFRISIPKSSDKKLNRLMCLSLRAPERCVAISLKKMRLLRFTRNDNPYRWI